MYFGSESNVVWWQSKCIMAAGETLASLLHRVIHNVIVSASHFLSVFTKANSIVHNCAPVTKHWHTLTRPFHNFYSHLRPHWLFGLGGDLCREIRIWWRPSDWQNIDTGCNCTIWKSSVSPFFLPLDPCSPPILPLEELDAQEPINFLPPLAIQRDALTWQANQQLFTLGKCDDEGGGGTRWLYKVTWCLKCQQKMSMKILRLVRVINQKKVLLSVSKVLVCCTLLHWSKMVLIVIIKAVMIGEECDILSVLLKTNQRVS